MRFALFYFVFWGFFGFVFVLIHAKCVPQLDFESGIPLSVCPRWAIEVPVMGVCFLGFGLDASVVGNMTQETMIIA